MNVSKASRKGQVFERQIADYLKFALRDSRIDIRPKNGKNDRGDIGGVRSLLGGDVVIECKNHKALDLAGWLDEAELERGNADAHIGVVVHKRKGRGAAGEQYVTMRLDSLVWLLKGGPDSEVVAA